MKSALILIIMLAWMGDSALAVYAPEYHVADEAKMDVQRSISALKTLPKPLRESLIAERLRLCFTPTGSSAYGYDKKKADERGVNGAASCWFTYSTAHFVGSDGKVYPLWATANRKKEKWEEAAMDKATNGVHGICAEAVFAGLADEVTMMCVKTVKNRLALLPSEMRDFFIAEKAMLFYRPGGGDAYTGEKGTKKFRATDIVNDYDCCYPDAKFVDSKGIERNVRELEKKRIENKLYSASWELASLCAKMVGVDDVLSVYGKELSDMKKFRKQAIEGTLSAPKNNGEEKYTISAETGRYIAALKGMPRQMREAYLAEKMGFCFTPGGEAAYEDRGHICTREGVRVSHYHAYANARFVCSNGKECSLYASMEKKSAYKQGIERLNGLAKIVMTSLFGSAEEAILKAMSKEIGDMALCTAKNRLSCMPSLMRYALFAEEGDLVFLPDGGSAYTGKKAKWRVPGTSRVCHYRVVDSAAQFCAPDGTVYDHGAVVKANWDRYGQAWLLARWCMVYLGKEKVFALFADEYKAMKAHQKNE